MKSSISHMGLVIAGIITFFFTSALVCNNLYMYLLTADFPRNKFFFILKYVVLFFKYFCNESCKINAPLKTVK